MTPDKALEVGIEACRAAAGRTHTMEFRACDCLTCRAPGAATTLAALRVALPKIVRDLRDILEWGAATSSDRQLHFRMLQAALAALAPEGGQT